MSDTPRTDAETMRDEYDHVDTKFGPFAPSDTVSADHARQLERELNEAKKVIEALKKLESAQDTLRLISVADWKTSGELRKMARDAWEKGSRND